MGNKKMIKDITVKSVVSSGTCESDLQIKMESKHTRRLMQRTDHTVTLVT